MTESASEWSDSASIADERVIAKAPNFAIAIATFATSAVITARRWSEPGADEDKGASPWPRPDSIVERSSQAHIPGIITPGAAKVDQHDAHDGRVGEGEKSVCRRVCHAQR